MVRLKSIADTLRGIPELASAAQFYAPDQVDDVLAAALRRRSTHSNRPELLASLLDLERELVERAVDTGREMARFREAATKKPTDTLKDLAEFGEDLVNTFNGIFGSHPFMSGASRPLGTLLFLEAAAAFDPSAMTARVASLMNITVIQSGKLTIDEMLACKITEGVILHEQPFVQVGPVGDAPSCPEEECSRSRPDFTRGKFKPKRAQEVSEGNQNSRQRHNQRNKQ
jgi:hypothetical protein